MPLPFGVRTLSWRMGRWRGPDTSLTVGEMSLGDRLRNSVAGKRRLLSLAARPNRSTLRLQLPSIRVSYGPRANQDRC